MLQRDKSLVKARLKQEEAEQKREEAEQKVQTMQAMFKSAIQVARCSQVKAEMELALQVNPGVQRLRRNLGRSVLFIMVARHWSRDHQMSRFNQSLGAVLFLILRLIGCTHHRDLHFGISCFDVTEHVPVLMHMPNVNAHNSLSSFCLPVALLFTRNLSAVRWGIIGVPLLQSAQLQAEVGSLKAELAADGRPGARS